MNQKSTSKILSGHILGAAAALFVPMAVLLAKGVAPVFAVTAMGVLVLAVIRDRAIPLLPGLVALFFGLLAVWSLVTWFWSIDPNETLKTGISLAATLFGGVVLFAAGARLRGREKEIFQNGMIFGGAVGFSLIAFEFATNAWLSRFLYGLVGKGHFLVQGSYTPVMNPGMSATALFFWPWALAVWSRFRGRAGGLSIAAAFGLIFLSDSDSVIFGFAAGAAVFALSLALPRWMPLVMSVVIAVGVLTAPVIPGLFPNPLQTENNLSWLSNSGLHRLFIWQNTVGHIKEKPFLGGGFDTARALYGTEDRKIIQFARKIGDVPYRANYEPIPLHPHNGVLQVWLELGAVGALILLGILLAVVRAIGRFADDKLNRAAALGALTVWLAIASISFGAWQSWWLASMLLGGAFMVAVLGPLQGSKPASESEEIGGPKGLEPTRYGDWERKGRAIDF